MAWTRCATSAAFDDRTLPRHEIRERVIRPGPAVNLVPRPGSRTRAVLSSATRIPREGMTRRLQLVVTDATTMATAARLDALGASVGRLSGAVEVLASGLATLDARLTDVATHVGEIAQEVVVTRQALADVQLTLEELRMAAEDAAEASRSAAQVGCRVHVPVTT